jgi:hypothetical protein
VQKALAPCIGKYDNAAVVNGDTKRMSQYQIAVIADGDSPYFAGDPTSRDEAFEAVKVMQSLTMLNDGKKVFVFDYEDDILIIDPEGSVIYAWNRDEPRDIAAYRSLDTTTLSQRKVLGWQIVDANGINIHGEDNDPFGLTSFEILSGDAAEQARDWVADNAGYRVVEVFVGDIDDPSVISRLAGSVPAPSAKPAP